MRPALAAVLAAVSFLSLPAPASAASESSGPPAHLEELQAWEPPEGARNLCRSYGWACASGDGSFAGGDRALLSLAREVNVAVNRRIEPARDSQLYGTAERWTLPQGGSGDCEDYALLKMRELLDRGVPPERLLLSVVVNDSFVPHVVLVLRSDRGDYFLDNMTDLVQAWHRTGYAVLSMQSPQDKRRWSAVFMGEQLAWTGGGPEIRGTDSGVETGPGTRPGAGIAAGRKEFSK